MARDVLAFALLTAAGAQLPSYRRPPRRRQPPAARAWAGSSPLRGSGVSHETRPGPFASPNGPGLVCRPGVVTGPDQGAAAGPAAGAGPSITHTTTRKPKSVPGTARNAFRGSSHFGSSRGLGSKSAAEAALWQRLFD